MPDFNTSGIFDLEDEGGGGGDGGVNLNSTQVYDIVRVACGISVNAQLEEFVGDDYYNYECSALVTAAYMQSESFLFPSTSAASSSDQKRVLGTTGLVVYLQDTMKSNLQN